MKLSARTHPVDGLSSDETEAMYHLMVESYEAIPRDRFDRDLIAKDEVILLHDAAGLLCGFTTLAWNPAGRQDEGDILFSGDTIITRRHWGTQELVRAFCRRAGQWRAASGRPLFWFLISKGHRTYLYLPLFARRFHPHPEHPEPAWQALAGRIADTMFGDCWKPDEGVIRFPNSHGHLQKALTDGNPDNPWIARFHRINPHHAAGEELVCLTEMDGSNLRRGALVAFRQGLESTP
jgi:hypothetical protein